MGLEQDIDYLRRAAFLSVLDTDALRLIAFNAQSRRANAGEKLFSQGEVAHSSLLITMGQIDLLTVGPQHREPFARPAHVGDLLDPYALVSRANRTATAQAASEVEYLSIDRRTFMRVMEEFPDHAEAVHEYIASQLEQNISEYAAVTARLNT